MGVYVDQINWPSKEESRSMRCNWDALEDAVAAVDGTRHRIYIPLVEPQRVYYSGYRHVLCIHTLVIVDHEGILRYVNSGFTGQNDAQYWNHVPFIGPNSELEFPEDCIILADKIFPNRYPLLSPFKIHQLTRRSRRERRICKKNQQYY